MLSVRVGTFLDMPRERGSTQELESVLDLLNEVQQATVSQPAAPQPPPVRSQRATAPNKLFEPIRIDGEEQLGRIATEDKLAILRKKVRALEDRLRDIQEAWTTRENELEDARQDAQRERQHREEAEASVAKLNAFLQAKKQEVEAYHVRVTEAVKEQLRREQEALAEAARREQQAREDADRREREAREDADRREQLARREAALREQETAEEHARREREALQAHSQREQEVLRQQAIRERALRERLEKAELAERAAIERELAIVEQQKGTPPPPPILALSDVEELDQAVTTAARTIADLLKGRLSDAEWQTAMRTAYDRLKESHQLLASVLRDMR